MDPTLTDAASYCYRVRVFNPTGYSDYSNTACSRRFQPTAGLAVVKMGPGSGIVVSAPTLIGAASEIMCGMNWSGTLASGTTVTQTATQATGSTFAGWSSGGYTSTGTCTLTLTSTMIVTATFNESQAVSLTVTKAGTGSGTSSGTGNSTGSCVVTMTTAKTVTPTFTLTPYKQ
ncbi:MAG TPA: hypothetical protein VJA65_01770 [bacterium]|nr:hypothetical protein [bacterium]